MQNIEKIEAVFAYFDNRNLTFWKIMSENTNNNKNNIISLDIKHLCFYPYKDKIVDFIGPVCDKYELPTIAANNEKHIELKGIFPPIKITNKRKKLTLKNVTIGAYEMKLLKMYNCDLSGIEHLNIHSFYCVNILSFARQLKGLRKNKF